jgi:hypothetical protein
MSLNFAAKKDSPVEEAAIIAAGPSLDQQIPALAEFKSRNGFIICADTALPVLLHNGIEPDAVVSIDCQHISYYHFIPIDSRKGAEAQRRREGELSYNLRDIPLFLDIASPPLLREVSASPVFFVSGHPLALYVSRYWKSLPRLDTSGGNVTYACLSLAENLGAKRITLFGADFSYIGCRTYARGTYIYPYFEKKQNRFTPLESLFSAFLYRSPFLESKKTGYYETASLRFYREKLEEKAAMMTAQVIAAVGQGAPINFTTNHTNGHELLERDIGFVREDSFSSQTESGVEFLNRYRSEIAALPEYKEGENYFSLLNEKEKQVFTTLLPLAAAIKHRNPALKTKDLIEETKRYCAEKIEIVL